MTYCSAVGAVGPRVSRFRTVTSTWLRVGVLFVAVGITACSGGYTGSGMSGSASSISRCLKPERAASPDIQRNIAAIRDAPICFRTQEVREGQFHWVFHILEHRETPGGPLWTLPHDNEDTAFDAASYAVITYGGALIAVQSGGRRRFRDQDPNRNFSSSWAESRLCLEQRRPSPRYTAAILHHYDGRRGPFLALHNNHDGWQGNGGRGTISIYRTSSVLHGFPSRSASGQLRDADNLVFIAGRSPPGADPAVRREIAALNAAGLNAVYKQVTSRSFDCSFSDYVAWRRLGQYYNVEAEYGHLESQKAMVDRLMKMLGIKPLRPTAASPFLD